VASGQGMGGGTGGWVGIGSFGRGFVERAWPQAGLQVAGLALARLLVGGVIGRGLHDIRGKKREKKEERESFGSRIACGACRMSPSDVMSQRRNSQHT